jgi:hypothetical protein
MPVAELLTNASQSNLAVSHFAISRKSVSNVLEVYLFTRGITSDSEKYDFLPIGEEIRKFCNFKDYNPNLLGFTRTAPASSNVHT